MIIHKDEEIGNRENYHGAEEWGLLVSPEHKVYGKLTPNNISNALEGGITLSGNALYNPLSPERILQFNFRDRATNDKSFKCGDSFFASSTLSSKVSEEAKLISLFKNKKISLIYLICEIFLGYCTQYLVQSPRLVKFSLRSNFINNEKGNEIGVKKISKDSYSGRIYDLTVPNHIILVKRENLVVYSGNCYHNLTSLADEGCTILDEKMDKIEEVEMRKENKMKTNYLCLICSLKSLASLLKLSAKCLWSDVRYLWSDIKCLRSDTKVANIKPIVKTAPILKTNRETIMFSTDQEPPKINLISWYAKKIPKITRRITATFTMYAAVLFSAFILTTNQSLDQPYNKKYDYHCNNSKHPINWFLFHKNIALKVGI